MRNTPCSILQPAFSIWRNPGRFTKNPDLVKLESGRLLLVYSDTDRHWSEIDQVLTILCSDDDGRTWSKLAEVDRADLKAGDERLVTPRLSALSDGRLVVICDHDDWGHFHEDQEPGNWLWWSADDGKTWSAPEKPSIKGFEPDRIIELPDGCLATVSHQMFRETQEFGILLTVSQDGGKTWDLRSIVAHDGFHRFCEGALVILQNNRLACVMRENHSGGFPSFVVFSDDNGQTWGAPGHLPFSFHRPYARQLPDGRVLVTGRNVLGGIGTYGWCGDLEKVSGTYAVGGPPTTFDARLVDGLLLIENARSRHCLFQLLPPQDCFSTIIFEAVLKVESPEMVPAACLTISNLYGKISTTGFVLSIGESFLTWNKPDDPVHHVPVDFSSYRHVRIRHSAGLLTVEVDGERVGSVCIFGSRHAVSHLHGLWEHGMRTTFGQMGNRGRSWWKSVSYSVNNRDVAGLEWAWNADKGTWPHQYQIDNHIRIHANDPDQQPWPDHGYSSWLPLDDKRIFLVDYTNLDDPPGNSHLVGALLVVDELPSG